MLDLEHKTGHEEPEISLLREWLPKISSENRAYIKGASEAFLHVQENSFLPPDFANSCMKKRNVGRIDSH